MPNQEIQEELLRAAVEQDNDALDSLAQKYGAIDSELLAADLQSAGTYFDSNTPARIAAVFARKDRRLQTANEILAAQWHNAAEDGPNHGYQKRSVSDY